MIKSQHGFTLLELTIVISLISILMLSAAPAVLNMHRDREVSNAMDDVLTVEEVVLAEYAESGDWPTDGKFNGDLSEFISCEESRDNIYVVCGNFLQKSLRSIRDRDEETDNIGGYGVITEGDYLNQVVLLEPKRDGRGEYHIHPDLTKLIK